MPIENPTQYELKNLEILLKEIERPSKSSHGRACAVFGIIGLLSLFGVYLNIKFNWVSSYWDYTMCFLAGVSIGGAAIINRLRDQSKHIMCYIDKIAVVERIKELKKVSSPANKM